MKIDNKFKFDIQVSNDYIEYKEQLEWIGGVNHFSTLNLNCEEILERLKMGYTIRHVIEDEYNIFSDIYFKKTEDYFIKTNMIVFDIDGSLMQFPDIINRLKIKPTIYHTSTNHNNKKTSAHLYYFVDSPIISNEEYHELWDSLYNDVFSVLNYSGLDINARYTYFHYSGSFNKNAEYYITNLIYTKDEIYGI